jgi:DivIVA domain-containing protein
MSTQDGMSGPMPRNSGPLSPSAIRGARFSRTAIGRRGYDTEEVSRFLYRVAEQVAAGDAEKANLRAEVERLRDWIRNRIREGGDESAAPAQPGLNAQMISLMSQAQQQADAYVAQAEAYSRRLTIEARQKADELIYEAQSLAHTGNGPYDSAEVAARLAEVQRRADWLRAFCQATQLQLQAASDAFFQEVARATHFPEPLAVAPEELRRSIR